MVITMAKLRMAHASTHDARNPPGPIVESLDVLKVIKIRIPIFKCSVLITITIRRSTLSYFAKCGRSYRYSDK